MAEDQSGGRTSSSASSLSLAAPVAKAERDGSSAMSPRRLLMDLERREIKRKEVKMDKKPTVVPLKGGTLKAAAVRKDSNNNGGGANGSSSSYATSAGGGGGTAAATALRGGKETHAVRRQDVGKDLIHPGSASSSSSASAAASSSPSSSTSSPSSSPSSQGGGGDVSTPARVVGSLLFNGLRARRRTDSLSTSASSPSSLSSASSSPLSSAREQRSASQSGLLAGDEDDGGASSTRKSTLSFKLTASQEDLSEGKISHVMIASPRETNGTRSTSPIAGDHADGDNDGGNVISTTITSGGRETESLRKALSREVQSSSVLRDKLTLAQKKSEFLERNREELLQLLAQLRSTLALEEGALGTVGSELGNGEGQMVTGADDEYEDSRSERHGAASYSLRISASQDDIGYDAVLLSPRERKSKTSWAGTAGRDEERAGSNGQEETEDYKRGKESRFRKVGTVVMISTPDADPQRLLLADSGAS